MTINVTFTDNIITVDENLTNVTVTSTTSNVTVSEGGIVTVQSVREALSAQSPILYNNVSGQFSFDSNASFAGKTTDDLAQGTSNIYFSTTGAAVNTTNLPEGTNLYWTTDRGNTNFTTNLAASDTGDLAEGTNLYYTNARVLAAVLDSNVKLKQFSETAVNKGNLSGNITLDAATGSIFYGTITGDITGITLANATDGTAVTLVVTQDGTGNHELDVATYVSNWNNWYFANDKTFLNLPAASKSYITVVYAGGVYNAAVVGYDPALENFVETNRQGATSVVTLTQGPYGGLYGNTNLAFGNAYLNTTTGDGAQRFLQSYVSGVWSTIEDGGISGLTVAQTGNDRGVVFGKFNPYSASPETYSTALIGLKDDDTLTIAELTSNSLIRPGVSISGSVDGITRFDNIGFGLGTAPSTERFSVVDTATKGAARFIGNVIIQPSNNQTNTTFKFGAVGNEILQLDHGAANTITARAPLTSNSSITTTANVSANYFIGNGSLLTGVNAQVLAYIATQGLTVGGNLQVNGNINATGNINYQNVTDLYVTDQKITLNSNAATNSDVRIISNRPTATNTELKWNESTQRWTFTNDGSTYYNIPVSTTDLAEGTNLYFSNARVLSYIQDSVTTSDVTEGTNLYYTTDRANSAMDAYLVSITANVDSVNGQTGVVSLDTDDVAEGTTNLYYSNARVNAFIQDNITTSDIDEGTNLYWTTDRGNTNSDAWLTTKTTSDLTEGSNLYFTTDRTNSAIDAYVVGSENINVTSGVISTKNALGNVNSVTTTLGQDLTLTSEKAVFKNRVRNDAEIVAANIEGKGYAIFDSSTLSNQNQPYISYSGTDELKTLCFDGSSTAGSNVITITGIYDGTGNVLSVSNALPYYVFTEAPGVLNISTTFPEGTYVVSTSGNNIYMSANALTSTSFVYDASVPYYGVGALIPAAVDVTTGLAIAIVSEFDDSVYGYPPGSPTSVLDSRGVVNTPIYAYPESGPVKADFNFAHGNADFTLNSYAGITLAKTDISARRTVPQFSRGLIVGNGDLTNRGVGDKANPTFGLNIIWDGTANVVDEYAVTTSTGVFPQILFKTFSDGTNQDLAADKASTGPRMLFITGQGKATDNPYTTYAITNQELGKIGWTSTTSGILTPSTTGPAAYISAVSLKDQTSGPGDVGLYLVASPTNSGTSTNQVGGASARALFLGHHKGNTIISAASRTNGTCGDIMFTPARAAANRGNAVQMAEQVSTNTVGAAQWARIGYDNPSANTGSRIEVTNGFNSSGARNGNLSVVINRNDNSAGFGDKAWAFKLQPGSNDLVVTEDNVIRTTFAAGGNINLTTNAAINYDEVYGCWHKTANVTAAAADTPYAFDWFNDATQHASQRVTIASNTQITFGKTGTYETCVQFQIRNDDNALRTAFVWLRKNGTDVDESCTRLGIRPKGSASNSYQLSLLEWLVEVNAGDYIEVVFAVDNTSGISLEANPAQVSPYARPAIPSAVLTVKPVGA